MKLEDCPRGCGHTPFHYCGNGTHCDKHCTCPCPCRMCAEERVPSPVLLSPGVEIDPSVVWITGLPAAGKTTLAKRARGLCGVANVPAVVLDGDEVRAGLSKTLSFTEGDVTENVRRTAEVAKLLVRQGLLVFCALVSPRAAHRLLARTIVPKGRFVEVYLDASLTLVESRDPKGLYARARRGELPDFFNVGGVYEEPARPDLYLGAYKHPEELARALLQHLRQRSNP